jgi:hypothetical protein
MLKYSLMVCEDEAVDSLIFVLENNSKVVLNKEGLRSQ